MTEPAGEPTSREPEHADEARGTLRAPDESRTIKCVVWDLDNTLWQGVVLENDDVRLSRHTLDAVKTLDGRGILQSIASKNEHDKAMAKLNELGVSEFFLYPQINWNSKAASVESIARSLNIGLDAVALIDDDPFEREEVAFSLPQVLCLDAAVLERLLDMPRMNPPFVTEDASRRRLMYLSGIERDKVEAAFVGPQEEFLASLRMILRIAPAREADLLRAEELTRRTNQLNTTGVTYSYDELNYFRQSDRHPLLLADLEDKFGGYGKIGLTLVECLPQCWTIKLLLMSCRVMSRGVGGVMISHVLQLARGRRRRAGGLRSEREKSYDVCDLQVRRLQRGATDGEGQGVGARPLTHPTLPILFQVRVRNLRAAQFRRPA